MRLRGTIAAALVAAVTATTLASGAEVQLVNGGFETGDFTGWKRLEPGGGHWVVYGGAPRGGIDTTPPEGIRAARVAINDPGANILHRVLRLKPGKRNKISLYLAYDNSKAGEWFSPRSFDFDNGPVGPVRQRGGGGGTPNQQIRIDLMKPRARIKSLRRKDILATPLRTRHGDPLARVWTPLRVNLTRLGIDRKRVRLRIAEVDNQAPIFIGVDDLTQTVEPR